MHVFVEPLFHILKPLSQHGLKYLCVLFITLQARYGISSYSVLEMGRVWNNHVFLDRSSRALIQLVNSLQPLNLLCPTAKWMSIVCADSDTVTWACCARACVCVCVSEYWPTVTSPLKVSCIASSAACPGNSARAFSMLLAFRTQTIIQQWNEPTVLLWTHRRREQLVKNNGQLRLWL